MASYTISHNAADKVTFEVTGLTAGNVVSIMFRPMSTNYLLYFILFNATSSTLVKTFPDTITSNVYSVQGSNSYSDGGKVPIYLDPNTQYTGRIRVYDSASDVNAGDYTDIGTVVWTTPKVTDWDWSISNVSATAARTQAAQAACLYGGAVSSFHHTVWNDLVNKSNEILVSRGKTWPTTVATLSETLMTSTDRSMTAKRYNAARWALSQLIATGLTEKTAGVSPLLGSDFTKLANAVNNAIWRPTPTYNPNG